MRRAGGGVPSRVGAAPGSGGCAPVARGPAGCSPGSAVSQQRRRAPNRPGSRSPRGVEARRSHPRPRGSGGQGSRWRAAGPAAGTGLCRCRWGAQGSKAGRLRGCEKSLKSHWCYPFKVLPVKGYFCFLKHSLSPLLRAGSGRCEAGMHSWVQLRSHPSRGLHGVGSRSPALTWVPDP